VAVRGGLDRPLNRDVGVAAGCRRAGFKSVAGGALAASAGFFSAGVACRSATRRPAGRGAGTGGVPRLAGTGLACTVCSGTEIAGSADTDAFGSRSTTSRASRRLTVQPDSATAANIISTLVKRLRMRQVGSNRHLSRKHRSTHSAATARKSPARCPAWPNGLRYRRVARRPCGAQADPDVTSIKT